MPLFGQSRFLALLHEHFKLKISRLIKGLSLNIAKKINLHLYLSFDDLYNPPIKEKRQLSGRKSFQISFIKNPSTNIESNPSKLELLIR